MGFDEGDSFVGLFLPCIGIVEDANLAQSSSEASFGGTALQCGSALFILFEATGADQFNKSLPLLR